MDTKLFDTPTEIVYNPARKVFNVFFPDYALETDFTMKEVLRTPLSVLIREAIKMLQNRTK